jgi:hypothetical protein
MNMKNKIGILTGIVLVAICSGFVLQATGYFSAHPKVMANVVLSQQLQASNPQALIQTSLTPVVSAVNSDVAARDAKRISDLKQLQNDLQLYHDKCGYYPGAAESGSSCRGFVAYDSYAHMSAALIGSGLGITSVPHDPQTGKDYVYGTNAAGTSYTLGAQLEDLSNSAFQQSTNDRSNGVNCGQAVDRYCVKL